MRYLASTLGILSALLLGTATATHAQSTGTTYTGEASRSISAFAEASRVYTDYGQDGYGFTFGGDTQVKESDFEGGVKLEKRFHRFTPYLDALVGYGVIHFDFPGYTHYKDSRSKSSPVRAVGSIPQK